MSQFIEVRGMQETTQRKLPQKTERDAQMLQDRSTGLINRSTGGYNKSPTREHVFLTIAFLLERSTGLYDRSTGDARV